jgi:hypothetical protein
VGKGEISEVFEVSRSFEVKIPSRTADKRSTLFIIEIGFD